MSLTRGPAYPPLGRQPPPGRGRSRRARARHRGASALWCEEGRSTGSEPVGRRERCLGWFPAPPSASRPRCGRSPLGGTSCSPPNCPAAAASALCETRGGLGWRAGAGRARREARGGRSGAPPPRPSPAAVIWERRGEPPSSRSSPAAVQPPSPPRPGTRRPAGKESGPFRISSRRPSPN